MHAQFVFEKDDFALSFRPWVHLSEDPKEFEFDPCGNDNPDIDDFLGRFEIELAYKWDDLEFTFLGRRNFATRMVQPNLGLPFHCLVVKGSMQRHILVMVRA